MSHDNVTFPMHAYYEFILQNTLRKNTSSFPQKLNTTFLLSFFNHTVTHVTCSDTATLVLRMLNETDSGLQEQGCVTLSVSSY